MPSVKNWNHNLLVTFAFRISFSLSQGLWNSGTGSNYIYYLEDKRNTLVGLVQGIQGICVPLASLPGGFLADRYRRDSVLKVFGIAGFCAIALTVAAVLAPQQPVPMLPSIDIKFGLLCVAYCFWGIAQAANPIIESILADSVPTGGRSAIYTSLFFSSTVCRSIGPLLAAVVFVIDGNVWRVSTLGTVMLVGMLFSVLPVSSLFFFNDNRSLGDESEARGRLRRQEPESGVKEEDSPAASREALHKPRLFGLSQAHIPLILCCSDIIYGLASGCTIKFFPIFFAKEVKLSPVAVNILMGAQPLAIAVLATFGQRLSVYVGRVQVLLALRLLGWVSMGIMAFTSLWRTPWLIVSIFLLRTAVNNSGYPVQKSVLMDHVPKKSRGKWSAVDSIVAFGWSGSAFLGGILVDRAGFDWCFLITAMAQATGWLVLFPLLALVPSKEVGHDDEEVTAPLLLPETGDRDGDTCGESQPDSLDLAGQIEALQENLAEAGGSGPVDVATKRTPDRAISGSAAKEEEFVTMVGSLKSPRRSIDDWAQR